MGQPVITTPVVPAPSEPVIRRPRWNRRVLIALLLTALAGGLWWNSTRLNETERKLVGVWKQDDQNWHIFVADGRLFRVTGVHPDRVQLEHTRRWSVSGGVLRSRRAPPKLYHVAIWVWVGGDIRHYWNINPDATASEIVHVGENEMELRAYGVTWKLHRSQDPDMVRMFHDFSSGHEPI